ncbi:MAG: 2-oxoacid:ferredoxin oxidoreductase subunit beta [Bacteroidetes bacterium]|nr:2-oxoacid:ferredoxin oxidoreductase subunit beta [Bacteroidota bacterium]
MSNEEKNTAINDQIKVLTAKDLASDQDVRWCPGCGDYSMLSQLQRTLPEVGVKKEDIAVVAGIGCSSRFPYYMSTYGFHGIHGRALAIASGLKVGHPNLTVWVATGDGDCLSIGGNHFIHALRRNVDINVMMFNNQIYALTKGQYSPTSLHGQKTKTSPNGVIDHPFNPMLIALGAEGTFVARSMDRDPKHLKEMMLAMYHHKGTSFIDVLQNCVIFNDGAFDLYTSKETRDENVVYLQHGKPLVFGKERDKGLRLDGFRTQVVSLKDYSENDLIVHDNKSKELAFILAHMNDQPGFPLPVGIFLDIERTTYEEELGQQVQTAINKQGAGTIHSLLYDAQTWEIENGKN